MKPIIAGLLALLATSPVAAIMGGEPVPPGKFPYVVSIFRPDLQNDTKSDDQCTGALISKNLILTAADCLVVNKRQKSHVSIGSNQRIPKAGEGHVFPIDNYTYPEDWSPGTVGYNIALVSFQGEHNVTQFAQLAPRRILPYAGTYVTAVGFGLTSRSGVKSSGLKELLLPTTDRATCSNEIQDLMEVGGDQFCGEACVDGEDATCEGDWGGPVIYHDSVIGIIAKGRSCRKMGCYPDVFTLVSRYLPFIREAMPGYFHPKRVGNGARKKKKRPHGGT